MIQTALTKLKLTATSWCFNPEIADLPAWVVALVAAGGIAAALSTTAGLLLVISTSVSHDLLKRIKTRY